MYINYFKIEFKFLHLKSLYYLIKIIFYLSEK